MHAFRATCLLFLVACAPQGASQLKQESAPRPRMEHDEIVLRMNSLELSRSTWSSKVGHIRETKVEEPITLAADGDELVLTHFPKRLEIQYPYQGLSAWIAKEGERYQIVAVRGVSDDIVRVLGAQDELKRLGLQQARLYVEWRGEDGGIERFQMNIRRSPRIASIREVPAEPTGIRSAFAGGDTWYLAKTWEVLNPNLRNVEFSWERRPGWTFGWWERKASTVDLGCSYRLDIKDEEAARAVDSVVLAMDGDLIPELVRARDFPNLKDRRQALVGAGQALRLGLWVRGESIAEWLTGRIPARSDHLERVNAACKTVCVRRECECLHCMMFDGCSCAEERVVREQEELRLGRIASFGKVDFGSNDLGGQFRFADLSDELDPISTEIGLFSRVENEPPQAVSSAHEHQD